MSQHGSRVVRLAELNRHIFTDEYVPQTTSTGEHELTFIQTSGMNVFFFFFFFFFSRSGIRHVLIDDVMRTDAREFVTIVRGLVQSERPRSQSRGRP